MAAYWAKCDAHDAIPVVSVKSLYAYAYARVYIRSVHAYARAYRGFWESG